MRLLNTKTGRFEEFVDLENAPPYAILSHTWDKEGEQSYQDVVKIQEKYGLAAHRSSHRHNWFRRVGVSILLECSGWAKKCNRGEKNHLSSPKERVSAQIGRIPDASRPSPNASAVHAPPRRYSIWDCHSGLSEKLRKACEVARRDGYEYIWVDSSCIDKTSSSELSEAINSMFNWYRGAQVCYAFLADVPSDEDVKGLDPGCSASRRITGMERPKDSKFRKSRWFKRAWTLQELIAPRIVVFLSREWKPLGTKEALADLIYEITRIDPAILTHKKALAEESVAERMRWAAWREATRVEDEAYSLLGIFGITMPTLYGEGSYAFRRLQEKILQRIPDRSLFAWGDECMPLPIGSSEIWVYVNDSDEQSLFAPSPRSFRRHRGKISATSRDELESLNLPVEEYTPTPYGIRTQLCLLPLRSLNPMLTVTGELGSVKTWYLVILGCQQVNDRGLGQARTGPPERLLGRLCYITSSPQSTVDFLSIPCRYPYTHHPIFSIAWPDLNRAKLCAGQLQTRIVHLPHPKPPAPQRVFRGAYPNGHHPQFKISLSSWTQAALQSYGYTISDFRATEHHSDSYSLTLFHTSFNIHIQCRYMPLKSPFTNGIAIEARIWTLCSESDGSEGARSAMVQHMPPYSSALWIGSAPWSMSLPPRRVHLVAPSENEVTLQLGFDLTTPFHYNTHIEITPDEARGTASGLSTRAALVGRLGIQTQHKNLKLTMLGAVRKMLETQGYSVQLEPRPTSDVDSCTLRLTISNAASGFTISVKYYHMLRNVVSQELIVAARVTLESSSIRNGDPSETYHDGPHVVGWGDVRGWRAWRWHSEAKEIDLTTPDGHSVALRLGLDLAWESEYYLLVDIGGETGSCSEHGGLTYLLDNPHDRISLTLPAHIKGALLLHGYEVRFKSPSDDNCDPYHLTLSDANLTIDIKYSYELSIASETQQGLTFRACVAASSLHSTQDAVAQPSGQIVDWDAWQPETRDEYGSIVPVGGWYWDLPKKDITLALPTGTELTLRLGFYLVWISEYCIIVEIDPLSPPSAITSHEDPRPSSPDTDYGSIDGETGDDARMQEMAANEAHDPEVAHSGGVGPLAALPLRGVEDTEVEEAGAGDPGE